jgi:hypothetical protein
MTLLALGLVACAAPTPGPQPVVSASPSRPSTTATVSSTFAPLPPPLGPKVTTARSRSRVTTKESLCDPAYPTVCIASPPPDLDCGDIPFRRFKVVQHPDPHRFDPDGNGIGCEQT